MAYARTFKPRNAKPGKGRGPRSPHRMTRGRSLKIKIPAGEVIDYKNLALLPKFLTDRGKIMSHRLTGIMSRQQRQLTRAIKLARFLGLLPSGSAK